MIKQLSSRETLRRMSRLVAVGVVVAAASGVWAGVASASSAASSATRTEHFYLMTTQNSSSKYVVIATGAFTAHGTDISGNTTDTVKLTGGGFKITHSGRIHITKEQLNPKTCFAVFSGTAHFTVGSGKGAYKGISGSGKATINEMAIFAKSKGKCNSNANPVANEQTITGTAHIKL
jgi:hypothetical protein